MYTKWKIERYAFADNAWSVTPDVLTSFHDPQVSNKLGDTVDTFSFKVTNFNGNFDNYFNASDKIVISRAINTTTFTSSDVLTTGIVKAVPNEDNDSNKFIRVEGVNFSETLARALVFIDGDNLTIPAFIQQALKHVEAYNDNFKVEWHPDNKLVKTDGTAFPTVQEKWYNKSLLKLLEKYSSKLITQDVNYYWYVDKDNYLVWLPREDAVSYNFSTTVDAYKSLKTSKDTKDVYNFIIMKGGSTPGGSAISTRVVNNISLAKHGFKPKIIVSEAGYAKTRISADLGQDTTTGYPSSYPFETSWTSSVTSTDAPACTKGFRVTVSSNGQYNEAIKREVKFLLADEANRFLDERGNGKLQVQLMFDAGKGWAIGDVISVTIPSIGKENDFMRVNDADYHVDSDSFVLIEDVGTV